MPAGYQLEKKICRVIIGDKREQFPPPRLPGSGTKMKKAKWPSNRKENFKKFRVSKDLDLFSGGLEAFLGFWKYFNEVSEEIRTFFNRIHTRKSRKQTII
jgi:hypothetical protein